MGRRKKAKKKTNFLRQKVEKQRLACQSVVGIKIMVMMEKLNIHALEFGDNVFRAAAERRSNFTAMILIHSGPGDQVGK